MAPPRPRRSAIRGALPILALVGLAAAGALIVGPTLSIGGTPSASAPSVAIASFASVPPPTPIPSTTSTPTSLPSQSPTPTPTQIAWTPPSAGPPQPSVPVLTPDSSAALQVALDRLRARYKMPGISAAILFPDGRTWTGVSGLARVAQKVPVTADTEFAVASVTKTFTSALVLALSREGRLAIDRPVANYLPELHLDPSITVRQLLDHTSGLRDYFFHPNIDRLLLARPQQRWTEMQALRYVGTPYFKPGRGWHYSNTNYLLLGMLAERVGEAPLGQQFRTRFFVPLHLGHTYYQLSQPARGPVAHGYRFVATTKGEKAIDLSDGTSITPFTSVITAAAGAGGIASTPTDLVQWARALYSGELLGADTVAAMTADGATTQPYRPRIPYGLGVQMIQVAGHPSLGHSGRFLGFRSAIRWLPDVQLGISVVTNQSRSDPGTAVTTLLRIALASTVAAPGSP